MLLPLTAQIVERKTQLFRFSRPPAHRVAKKRAGSGEWPRLRAAWPCRLRLRRPVSLASLLLLPPRFSDQLVGGFGSEPLDIIFSRQLKTQPASFDTRLLSDLLFETRCYNFFIDSIQLQQPLISGE